MFVWSASPVDFSIGFLNVYWYGILYALSLASAWLVSSWVLRKLRTNSFNVPTTEQFDSFMFWAIVSVIAGARLGHALFFDLEFYINNPFELLMIRNGGLSFHGGFIGLAIYTMCFIRKHQFSWKVLADTLSLSAALGLGIGRIANFMNQELYGKIAAIDMAVIFPYVDHMPRYPTQLWESFFEGFLNFWLLFVIFRFKGTDIIGKGILTSIFCVFYSSARFFIEFYKEVEAYTYFNCITLTVGQVLSIAMFVFGIFVLYLNENKSQNNKSNA